MSSTLVEAMPPPPPGQFLVRDAYSVPRASVPAGPPRHLLHHPNVVQEPWVVQLAHLASQHHLSEYNRMKYGHQGCPVAYAPLSVHVPDLVRELRDRQAKYTEQTLWWPCAMSKDTIDQVPVLPAIEQRQALGTDEPELSHPDLQQELSAAISEPLSSIPQPPSPIDPALQMKTSETHPINISTIIPPESTVTISSHLSQCSKPSPVMFDIPLAYSLDRITGYLQLFPSLPPMPSRSLPPLPPPVPLRRPFARPQSRHTISEALQAAISSRLVATPPVPPSLSRALSLKNAISKTRPLDDRKLVVTENTPKPTIPRQFLGDPSISNRASSAPPDGVLSSVLDPTPSSRLGAVNISWILTEERQSSPQLSPPRNSMKLRAATASPYPQHPRRTVTKSRPFKLGNLLLSSCPGKKVRLSGPVKGRGTVCRDLSLDLQRIKDLGVRCVVCCLDDEELQFLGVSWPDYYQAAHRIDLDVLRSVYSKRIPFSPIENLSCRIPLPEGLTPLTPESLDAHLKRLIDDYTLHGLPILVHCRGGVGRAGLVACCWMLKLGLCGWIETDVGGGTTGSAAVRHDTVLLIERAIAVVRRRRSVKAIETLEQVKFLADYVEYLRRGGVEGMAMDGV
ncbi:phosphatases II [Leucogyrophana mollusca]|uniref:Phosphatases II n=1 Tax=Leucogyrophana mollusca TaxID=85980 RepID=A0ACB8BEK5_9AGAM|nr:phosphatases II [Leucogyrophana mollusca]